MKTPIQLLKAIYGRLYYYLCPDKIYLNRKFKEVFGRDIDWKHPKTFNEKLQWLKVYDRNPLYTKLVDKYAVREYIAEKIGEEYLIPLLGVWDRVEDIDFDSLPDQFVLKCTHDSASVIICRDKKTFDIEQAKKKLSRCLKRNFYYSNREWPYKNVKPRVIAEKYIVAVDSADLADYKIVCFNGEPSLLEVHTGRFTNHTQDFYDCNWNHLPVSQDTPLSTKEQKPPQNWKLMLALTRSLANVASEVRVDWYSIGDVLLFGELTFFDGAGFTPFDPPEWDEIFGSNLRLPSDRGE